MAVADAQSDQGRSQDMLLNIQHHRNLAMSTSREPPDME
jgi:hypothetical protein